MVEFTKEFWSNTYQTNIGKLIGIGYRYTGNYSLAEDLAHDAFIKAIEKAHSFRGDGNFDAWLRRIVVNHVLDYLRSQKKIPFTEPLTPDHPAVVAAQDHVSSTKAMEFTAMEVLETINQLPEHHRLVFNLYVLEKFSHARIGEALGISEGTSKSHLARARKKLQLLFTEKIMVQKDQENKERAAVLLFAPGDDARTDQMCAETFDQFSLPPKMPLSLDFNQHMDNGLFKNLAAKKSLPIIVTSLAAIAISFIILFTLKNPSNNNKTIASDITSAPIIVPTDSKVYEKNSENVMPPPATIPKDSVNTDRNLKLNSMKPLDSLALLLVLSSGPVHAASLIDSIKNQIQSPGLEITQSSIDSNLVRDQSTQTTIPVNVRDERGTFRASRVLWDKDDMKLYFKGAVIVNFKDQHFLGNGSFTILGKVYLLIVDDEQIPLGKTIKLEEMDYHLAVLNSTEASSKYGDVGKDGAVLIYRSK